MGFWPWVSVMSISPSWAGDGGDVGSGHPEPGPQAAAEGHLDAGGEGPVLLGEGGGAAAGPVGHGQPGAGVEAGGGAAHAGGAGVGFEDQVAVAVQVGVVGRVLGGAAVTACGPARVQGPVRLGHPVVGAGAGGAGELVVEGHGGGGHGHGVGQRRGRASPDGVDRGHGEGVGGAVGQAGDGLGGEGGGEGLGGHSHPGRVRRHHITGVPSHPGRSAGAVHHTVAALSRAVAPNPVGAAATLDAMTSPETADGTLDPLALIADTAKLYRVPLVKLDTDALDVVAAEWKMIGV